MVVGAGGKDLYGEDADHVKRNEEEGMKLKKFVREFGFGYFEISKSKLTCQFVDEHGQLQYEYSRNK